MKRRRRRSLLVQLLERRLPLAGDLNDQPSFSAVDPQPVLEDSGPQLVEGFATFDPGAPDESDQSVLAYHVDDLSDPDLFAVEPAVNLDGDLTFEPAADAFGTATFSLAVQDDGGTAGGGIDLSAKQTFTISLVGVNDRPSFTIDQPAVVNEDSGSAVVPGFAANFDPGPAEDGTSDATQVIHDEGPDGTSDPLSADNLNPTDLGMLAHGSNVVRGHVSAALSTGDVDVFTFTIDTGFQLSGLFVDEYDYITPPTNPNERNAFLAIDDSDSFPYNAQDLDINSNPFLDETLFIGGTVFGLDDLPGVGGGDILPRAGVITGSKFTPPLPAGTYTFYIQQTGPANTYALDLRVTEITRQSVVAYSVTNVSDPSLFDSLPQIDSRGDLRFTPKDDASGSVTFDVTVQDDGGTDNGGIDTSAIVSGSITVNAVNDRPSFTLQDQVTLFATAEPQSIPGFASNFIAGPGDESGQSVQAYHVTNVSEPSLFAVLPAIDANGTLTFTPHGNAFASASFEVSVQDNGGTDNGGNDRSPTLMATINLLAPPDVVISPSGPGGTGDPPDLASGPQPTSWATQRSDLRQIEINLPTPISLPQASDLVLTNLGVNAPVDPDQPVVLRDDQLSISQDGLQLRIHLDAGQLGDGIYQLDLLTAITGGETHTIVGDDVNKFFVLRGDWNGSGGVSMQDFATFAYWFQQAVPTAPDYVDTNHSGGINIQDFSGFAANFGTGLTFPGGASISAGGGEGELVSTFNSLINPNDVDGDGKVTRADAVDVIAELSGGASGQRVAWSVHDVDRNGIITPLDALRVINQLAKPAQAQASAESVDQALDQLFDRDADDESDKDDIVAYGLGQLGGGL